MRRRVVIGSLAMLPVLSTLKRVHAHEAGMQVEVPVQYSSFDEWMQAARESTLQFLQTAKGREPEYFIRFLALWGAALPHDLQAWPDAWTALPGANALLEFNMLAGGRPFVVSALRMAPGCLLPAHCHPGGGGITLCLDGALSLEHFQLAQEQPHFSNTGSLVEVRLDSVTWLTRDRHTWFTPTASNLHQLRAGPQGAIALDLAVQWEGAGEFSFLRFEDERGAEGARVGQTLAGKWTGMNIADAYV